MFLRKECNGTLVMFTPSMSISPAGSARRKSAVNSELLPAPVLPTIPTLNKTITILQVAIPYKSESG